MRYSLLSQFQGVLVGAAIGELLGVCWATQVTPADPLNSTAPPLPLNCPEQWSHLLTSAPVREKLSVSEPRWGRLVVLGAQSLVRRGDLDFADWQPRQPNPQGTADLGTLRASLGESLGASELAIASLPIALFFHEDEAKLYQNLERLSQEGVPKPSSILPSFMISLAIAQALQNQFHPQRSIPQMIAAITRLETRLGRPVAEANSLAILMQQLAQVQTLLEQQASLERVRSQLCQSQQALQATSTLHELQAIMAALYCCLATPNDWRLAVLRSLQMQIAPALVATLTGAISGAANSLAGIPVEWRLALDHPDSGSTLKSLWQVVEFEAEIMELGSALLATWSGTYDTQKFPVKRYHVPAIAAPRVIRPR
uniref:ADP-ribosylglycohydrolase family protein n=1 Tax=Trichocoleus desertorum TaxID=1481672 RepID=UPI0025B504BB|nr:ADP-ribosylglycohydrolase family protein [Trichocoleus desertorum]